MSSLSSSLYLPLVLFGIVYAAVSIAAGRMTGREDAQRAERARDIAFALALAAAAYTAILLIVSAVSYPSRFTDAVTIILVVAVFFALLLFAFFVIAEVLLGRLGRRSGR